MWSFELFYETARHLIARRFLLMRLRCFLLNVRLIIINFNVREGRRTVGFGCVAMIIE